MRKKLMFLTVLSLCALMITACSKSSENTSSASEDTVSDSTSVVETEAVDLGETVGVWTYNNDIVFHSADGNRYMLTEDNSGNIQDSDGKIYAVSPCDYRLYAIMNHTETELTVSEGRYLEAYLNSKDYPDGYKKMIITYEKSDLFNIDRLEEVIKNPDAVLETETQEQESETEAETQASETETETQASETEAETQASETEAETQASETEAETQASETEAETQVSEIESDDMAEHENAEYASIYKQVQDFLETDNYQQKDPGNRSLEIFNYLHNQGDANIDQNSITNDTSKNEVSFKCYEDKYTFVINNTDATITVTGS